MLRLTLAIALIYAVSAQPQGYGSQQPSYGQQQSYGQQPHYGPDPLVVEVNNLIGNVSVLASNDESIDVRIRSMTAQDAANSALTERFQNEIFPGFRKEQATQNTQITELENQAKLILSVSDDVGVIANTLAQLRAQLDDVEAVKANRIRPAINDLRAADAAQDARLDNVDNGLDQQEARINEIFRRSTAVRDRIIKMKDTLHEVFDILGSETAQTIEFTVTRDQPEVTKCLSVDFGGRVPFIQYGFTGIHTSDHSASYNVAPYPPQPYGYGQSSGYGQSGYGQSAAVPQVQDNPNIYWDIDVDYDAGTNKATVRLYDLSDNGWVVEKVTARVVFYRVDNRVVSTYSK